MKTAPVKSGFVAADVRRRTSVIAQAYTLLEMMIAISIFALIMLSIYSSWMSIVRGTQIGLTAAVDSQRARIAMHAIEDALLTVQMYDTNDTKNGYYDFIVDSKDKFSAVQFTSRLPGTFLGSGYFGEEVVRRVTFFVEAGDNNENNLIMTQVPLLDAREREDPYRIVLARDVTHFELEFLVKKEGKKDMEFSNEYLDAGNLPKLARITLGIGHLQKNASVPNQVIVRVVNIPSDKPGSRF